jgi:hypothetical protein
MTATHVLSPAATLRELRTVVTRSVRAPSIHNTQPWQFTASPGALLLRADRHRQLGVLDPTGRQLVTSCGCALFNTRVAAAAVGLHTQVTRFPDPHDPDLLARLDVVAPADDSLNSELARLAPAIARRHTNRRRFADDPVPADLVHTLRHAAELEGATLIEVTAPAHRTALAALSQRADAAQISDPAYRAELRSWTSDDPSRLDGVSAVAVPHVDAGSGDDVPIRDFDSHGRGQLPTKTCSTRDQCLLVLAVDRDDVRGWLAAGEALQRVLLEITDAGYAASVFSQVIEVASTRSELRRGLALTAQPMMVIRVGRARPTPGTQRRRLADVFSEDSSPRWDAAMVTRDGSRPRTLRPGCDVACRACSADSIHSS